MTLHHIFVEAIRPHEDDSVNYTLWKMKSCGPAACQSQQRDGYRCIVISSWYGSPASAGMV